MRPILFHVFDVGIPSFGVMVALAVIVGIVVALMAIERLGGDPGRTLNRLMVAVVAGVVGARLWWVVESALRGNLGENDAGQGLLSGGLTWYGALILGLSTLLLLAPRAGIQIPLLANAVAPGLAIGQGIGRIGCFLAGDDYGRPTDSWVGIAFPEGSPPVFEPVHPTQLYEMGWLFLVGFWLWRRLGSSRSTFAEYLILAGAGRFAVEFLRRNPDVLGPLTSAQTVALISVLAGIWIWIATRNDWSHSNEERA